MLNRLKSLGLLGLTSAVVFTAISTLLLWVMFTSNPLGGEPHIALKIKLPEFANPQTERTKNLNMRTSLRPEDGVKRSTAIDDQPQEPTQTTAPKNEKPRANNPQKTTARKNSDKALRPSKTVKALIDKGPNGLLPRISRDGRAPRTVYARKIDRAKLIKGRRARLAILINGMGLNASSTNDAITRLPGEITLAFAPYARGLNSWRRKAQQNGHEVMLQIPMQPFDYPDNDPGPYTLLNRLGVQGNIRRLHWLMGRFTGYFGVTNYMGAKFTSSADALRPILQELHNRGLVYVEAGTSGRSRSLGVARQVGIGHNKAHIIIDAEASKQSIDKNLKRLETLALERGLAIGAASGLPITIDRIAEWAETLKAKGITLVPISATILKPSRQARS